MTHAPRIPREQCSYADSDRRDLGTEVQAGQPGDSDANLGEQGRFGNLKQNLTNQWKVQDR